MKLEIRADYRATFKLMIDLLHAMLKSIPLRAFGFPLDIEPIHDIVALAVEYTRSGEHEDFELTCFRIFETRELLAEVLERMNIRAQAFTLGEF